ncbi:MAG TPA: amidohydrolase, partial [Sphingomonadales bacterium]
MGWRAVLVAACLAAAPPAAAWDVGDTGEPARDVAFTVDEGSWMSLDVSPDGKTIVFDLLGDIYAIPASGGTARLVHGGPAIQRNPVFSRDGRQILYVSDESGSDNVWLSDADGGNARQVTAETVAGIAGANWGPDGHVVAARLLPGHDFMRASELRLYHPKGGAGRVIVPAPANGEHVHEAEFSPDGRFLYY